MHPVAARRILRLSLGTALCLLFSQAIAWPLSFVSPVLTLFILALPLPPPRMRGSIVFVVALAAPMIVGGWLLLPFLEHMRATGILLVALGLFFTFYFTARGGQAVLGTFMTVGLTLIVTVGSINSEIMIQLVRGLFVCSVVAIVFVRIAHTLLPDLPPDPNQPARKKAAPGKPDPADASRRALRSLIIVGPLALAFLFMAGSPAYTVVMIKVATMGQQASADESREMGRSLMESTLWGGLGAIIGWYVLAIWPSLLMYTLLTALAGLVYGRWIFMGPAVHPKFQMATYAFLTLFVILAPAVLDGAVGSGAGAAFWNRILLFVLIAVYGTLAVRVFDAFWPQNTTCPEAVESSATRHRTAAPN